MPERVEYGILVPAREDPHPTVAATHNMRSFRIGNSDRDRARNTNIGHGGIAQMVEQPAHTRYVPGSIPGTATWLFTARHFLLRTGHSQ